MRSNDIARLAGVSVRTLRHYHQIGLLSEPPRTANGYRSYNVSHLIRLRRIGQLANLGMRLSEIPAVIDNQGAIETSTLDELDRALAQEIAVLERQRKTIAYLRERHGAIDIPLELVTSLMSLEEGRTTAAKMAGREQAVLFGHIFDDEERTALACLYDRLAGPVLADVARELGERYDALCSESDEQTISNLAETYVERLGPWIKEFEQLLKGSGHADIETLLWEHAVGASNVQQRRMMAQVSVKLKETSTENFEMGI